MPFFIGTYYREKETPGKGVSFLLLSGPGAGLVDVVAVRGDGVPEEGAHGAAAFVL